MCGIAGIIKFGDKVITEEMISVALCGNEHRGNDASGIMLQQADGSIDLFKRDVPGWTLVKEKEYGDWIEEKLTETTRGAFVHARGASKGNPRDNNNNHPMFAGQAAIIHNGVIRNDDQIFKDMKLERKAETDSDAIRAIVDKHGITKDAVEALGKCFGSGAICAIHPRFPGKVLIVRSGNPLNIAHDKDFLYFSSEKDTLHKFTRPWIKRFGIWAQENRPDVAFSRMADDSAWIMGFGGLEYHGLCKINAGSYAEPWRKTYEEYETRSKKWDDKKNPPGVTIKPKPITTEVPAGMKPAACVCGKQWVIPFKDLFSNYTCNQKRGGCGKVLHDPEMIVKVH
jgi:asparagine synthetase B (glutamine-hydrolysing)